MLACTCLLASFGMMSCQNSKSDASADSAKTETVMIEEMTPETAFTAGDTAIMNIEEGVAELEGEDVVAKKYANAKVDHKGFKTTPSGLMYKQVKAGNGVKPAGPNSTVLVHYTGKKLDGTVFDSSVERGEPIEFPLNAVIKGWTEGVQLMNVGSKYEFIIPANLAYGQTGTPGGPIGPNEDLYFEVELLNVR